MLWDHPFLFTLLVDFLIQFAHSVGAGHLDVGDFVVRFSLFPAWTFVLAFVTFWVVRRVVSSYAYRLAHTYYHSHSRQPLPPVESFLLKDTPLVESSAFRSPPVDLERDISEATPITPRVPYSFV
jgi:hypothetical protein